MKRLVRVLIALSALTTICPAQAPPNFGAYFGGPYTTGVMYKIIGSSGGYAVFYPSKLIDDGTNLYYNGQVIGLTGPVGPAGPQGVQGIQGIQGLPGSMGQQGIQGVQGPAGSQGAPGPMGATGSDGQAGPTGAVGAAGVAGAIGNVGATGDTGAQGVVGATGGLGPQGVPGATGATGAQGIQGLQGALGLQGPIGSTGPQGGIGMTGQVGAQGLQGIQGIQGMPGILPIYDASGPVLGLHCWQSSMMTNTNGTFSFSIASAGFTAIRSVNFQAETPASLTGGAAYLNTQIAPITGNTVSGQVGSGGFILLGGTLPQPLNVAVKLYANVCGT